MLAVLVLPLGMLSPAPAFARPAPVRKLAAPAPPQPSDTVSDMAGWIAATDDADGRPFVIIDKLGAAIFVFDDVGALVGSAPALVGLARGDDPPAGLGDAALSAVHPDERITPAGRFLAHFGPAAGGKQVLWVDWTDGISLHPVVTSNPKEHRLKRIRSADPDEHRISYGCINVPAKFYQHVVLKAFESGSAVVYILPDTKPLRDVFPGFAITRQAGHEVAAPPATEDPVEITPP